MTKAKTTKPSLTIEQLQHQLQKILENQTKLLNFTIELNEELKIKNTEFQDIIESLPHGLVATNTQGKILHFNNAMVNLTQISTSQAKGKNINKIFNTEIISKNLFSRHQKQGSNYHYKFQYTNKKKEVKNLECTLVPLQSRGIIIHIEDVTLVNKLQLESERKNRLATMGKMAATIAHEVRNPLASIELFTSMLAKEFFGDKEKLEILGYIQQSVKTANYTISNLLQHTKPVQIQKTKVDLSKLLEKFYKINKPIAQEQDYYLILENLKDKFIEADAELLNQVLKNLFNNAMQAIEKFNNQNNQIKIMLQEHKQTLRIIFQDKGCGMTAQIQEKIFQPFYSTKNRGIGLGMSVVKNIMDKHCAKIFIESKENIGTKIFLEFPTKT